VKPTADIAIIVPVLDDLEALTGLAAQIAELPTAPIEVIVVSGRPDSSLRQRCRRHGFRLGQSHANRGAQLDHGARMAKASTLWFLHADAKISPTALDDVVGAIESGADGGCFRFAFQGPGTLHKRVIASGVALRIRFGGIVYGDQALFCTRRAYFETPGFTHDPLFEEVKLVKALRRPPHRFAVLKTPVFVAPRRWERDGWLRRSLHNRWLALCYTCGVSTRTLDERYRRVSSPPEESRV
jgi:rSAM/selenodomain-associated transferase 2